MDKKPYMIFFALGSELVVAVLALAYVGYLVDQKMGWRGPGMLVGAVVGTVSWAAHLYYQFRAMDDPDKGGEGPGA